MTPKETKAQKETNAQKDLADKEFDHLQREGALKFGIEWYNTNFLVVSAAQQEYLHDFYGYFGDMDIRLKALLSQIAWNICESKSQID